MKKNEKQISKNKPGIDLEQFVFKMVEKLSERPRDIVVKRFNFNGNKEAKTLEEIGKEYRITRERVRQIEFEAVSKLKKIGIENGINRIFESVENNIQNYGGFASEEKIVNYLFGEKSGNQAKREITLFILSLDDRIKEKRETKLHRKIYFYQEEDVNRFKNVIKAVEEYLKRNKKELGFDEMLGIINKYFKNEEDFSSAHLESYLSENKIILRNVLGQWGYIKWPQINPRNVKDKAYLALKKNRKPLHFVEITAEINKLWQGNRSANNQTVHNELIKDDRFILIGRGIYALQEWGYSAGIVLEVIMETLKAGGGKMEKSDIIEEVLKKRRVKENTVALNLQNRKYFKKEGRAYRLSVCK
ncbi:MAG: sigma factor-like helix-turn-helix DNA-binding protein [Patescibacteria group bacterium]|nr:sigma factor-like helix-turn-helix DNA-binding protein [Patescibacteria group bacterium]